MKYAIVDTETTGLLQPSVQDLSKQPKIIELGMILIEDGKKIGWHNWLINPEEQITAEITKITGITNADLEGKPTFKDIEEELIKILSQIDVFIAHNAPFDHGMLTNEFLRIGKEDQLPKEVICTVQEYIHLFGKRPRLVELYQHILGKPLEQTHRALDDCEALWEILEKDNFFELMENSRG